MKVERVDYYCDRCGCGDSGSGNVEYLGWVFLSGSAIGLIGESPIELQLCYNCYPEVVKFIGGIE